MRLPPTLFGDTMRLRVQNSTNSLLILKGDFAATFRLWLELIIINLKYVDQLTKEEDPIRDGKFSAFLLHAVGVTPFSLAWLFAFLRYGQGPFVFIISME